MRIPLLLLSACTAMAASAGEHVHIPAATFQQGSGRSPDEPLRTVALSAYDIDATEVTVAQFEAFAASGYDRSELWSADGRAWLALHPGGAGAELRAAGRSGDHPVVAVTFYEAEAYCHSVGGTLPTEAQWEHAACGDGGQRYPWGDDDAVAASWYHEGKFGQFERVETQPADGQDPALRSPFGLQHMAGNVWEWTADHYHRDGTRQDGVTDPTGLDNGLWRTLRGGSYMNLPSYCTCTHREPARPDRVAFTTGFRCVYPSP